MAEKIIKEKKIFCFKEYYNNNPEFRERHIKKLMTKITCSCGRVINTAHKAKHERSNIHKKLLIPVEPNNLDIVNNLKIYITELENKLKVI